MVGLELPILRPDRGRHVGSRAALAVLALVAAGLLLGFARMVWLRSRDTAVPPGGLYALLGLLPLAALLVLAFGALVARSWSGSRVEFASRGFSYRRPLRRRRLVPWSGVLHVEFRPSTVVIRVRGAAAHVMIPLGGYENPGAVVDCLYEHVPWDRITGEASQALTIRGRYRAEGLSGQAALPGSRAGTWENTGDGSAPAEDEA